LTAAFALLALAFASQELPESDRAGVMGGSASRKPAQLQGAVGSHLRHTMKLSGPLSARVHLVEGQLDDVFVVRGEVSTSEDVSHVDFQWTLPDDVEVVEGVVSGTLDSGREFIDLTLRRRGTLSADHEMGRIHLTVSGEQNGMTFGNASMLMPEGVKVQQ